MDFFITSGPGFPTEISSYQNNARRRGVRRVDGR